MGRITEELRLPMVDAHLEHYAQANQLAGTPILIEPGYGITQLEADRVAYDAITDEILLIDETDLPLAIEQRDGLFGVDAKDLGGVRFRLLQYKQQVRVTLGVRHALVKTVPNVGKVRVGRYLAILDRFLDHWQRVNQQSAQPMLIGDLTIAGLEQRHANIEAKMREITGLTGRLGYLRAERERIFGDVPEEERELTSIVARLQKYHSAIQTRFTGQSIAQSLPEIFPAGPATLPTFGFNWAAAGAGDVSVWFQRPADVAGVATVFLKEGAVEFTTAVTAPPGQRQRVTWSDVVIVDEVDQVMLRDAQSRDVARGVRNTNLADPGA